MAQVVGWKTWLFGYTHFGGNNNLAPGRPETQSVQMGKPSGSTAFAAIEGINFAFINGNLGSPSNGLRDAPLGQMRASLTVTGDTLECSMRLTSESQFDNPCLVHVRANVLFLK
jgi:hypothetical protein